MKMTREEMVAYIQLVLENATDRAVEAIYWDVLETVE